MKESIDMTKQKNLPIRGKEPVVTLELAKDHGLLKEEYERILQILCRVPTFT